MPVFVQFLDDDIASLTALTLIVDPKCRNHTQYASISQLTLSLYLMTQCQLKLRHSLTSLAQTLDYIEVSQRRHTASCPCVLDKLTLKSIESKLMTIVCHPIARDFGSVATIATTDFEALYAYNNGDYQHCLELSTQNVPTLLYAVQPHGVPIRPEFVQLLDDDIVSLTALTLIVNPKCREYEHYASISQLTLSLYLMTKCQLKIRHSLTSLAQTLDCIEVAQRKHRACCSCVLDKLTLKLIEGKVMISITT